MRLRDLYGLTRSMSIPAALVALLTRDGWSAAYIAELLNVSQRTVRRYRSEAALLDTCSRDTIMAGGGVTPAVTGTNVSHLLSSLRLDAADGAPAAAQRVPRRVERCYSKARERAGLKVLPLRPFEVDLAEILEDRGTFAPFGDEELVERFATTIRELTRRSYAVSLRSVADRDGETWRPIGGPAPGAPAEVSTVPKFDGDAYREELRRIKEGA